MRFSDEQLLQVARKYNLIPGSLKNKVFLLLEQGRSLEEIRFLLRRCRNPDRPETFARTVWRYAFDWRNLQASGRQNKRRVRGTVIPLAGAKKKGG